jgi:hypothetical protein
MIRTTASVALAVLSSLAAASCGDSDLCPAAYVVSSVSVAFEREAWTPTDYSIELSYRKGDAKISHTCKVRVPVLVITDAGSDDGGVAIAVDFENAVNDAGSEEDAYFIECTSSPRSAAPLRAVIGRVILININDTPEQLHLVVRASDEVVLERDLDPKYETTYPVGADCSATDTARLRVTLP